MIKLVIFDFDGTLADTHSIVLGAMVSGLKDFGINTSKKYLEGSGKTMHEVLKTFGVNKKNVPEVVKRIKSNVLNDVGKIKLAPGISELNKINVKKIVVTNSLGRVAKEVLKKRKIRIFSEVHGTEEFKSKFDEFKKLMRAKKIKSNEIIYVGDRALDAKLAKRIGSFSILVSNKISWSNSEQIIESNPDFIVSSLKEIPQIVDSIGY